MKNINILNYLIIFFLLCITQVNAQSIITSEPLVNAILDKDGNLRVIPSTTSSKYDFDFFDGMWKIHNKKLKTRLDNCTEWIEYSGTNEVKNILNGIGHTNNNRSVIEGKAFEGVSLTLFNPVTRLWSIYWASSRNGVLDRDNPVVGSFEGNIGTFYAKEVYNGTPVIVMARWDKSNPDSAVWSQAFSADNGKTWEWNWYMHEIRVDESIAKSRNLISNLEDKYQIPPVKFDDFGELIVKPSPNSSANDFDFLTGEWKMLNRRLKKRLDNSTEWMEYESYDKNFGKILNGIGNTDIFRTNYGGKPYEGFTLRLYNPETRLWSLYWVDSNTGVLDPPVTGSFDGNIGMFFGKDVYKGQPVLFVFVWDKTDPNNPVWAQAFSPDNGKTWEWNMANVSRRIR